MGLVLPLPGVLPLPAPGRRHVGWAHLGAPFSVRARVRVRIRVRARARVRVRVRVSVSVPLRVRVSPTLSLTSVP